MQTTTLHPIIDLLSSTSWLNQHDKGKQFWLLPHNSFITLTTNHKEYICNW